MTLPGPPSTAESDTALKLTHSPLGCSSWNVQAATLVPEWSWRGACPSLRMGFGRRASRLGERRHRCWIQIHQFKHDLGHVCGLTAGHESPGSAMPPPPNLNLHICQVGSHSDPPDPLRRHRRQPVYKKSCTAMNGWGRGPGIALFSQIWETHQEQSESPQGACYVVPSSNGLNSEE